MAFLLSECRTPARAGTHVGCAWIVASMLAIGGFGFARTVSAESQFSVAAGYSITGPADGPLPIGWFLSAAVKPADVRWLRVVSEIASEARDTGTRRQSERAYLFMNGVRLTANTGKYASVFGEALVGVYHMGTSSLSETDTNHLTTHAGGGVDLALVDHVAARFQLVARHIAYADRSDWSPVFMTAIVFGPARNPKR